MAKISLGINLEFVRHDDKPFEWGVAKAAELGYEYVEPMVHLGRELLSDGKRVGATPPHDWVAPDGALCDCARPGWIVYKQGDGRIKIHDWGMEFTAAVEKLTLATERMRKAIARTSSGV